MNAKPARGRVSEDRVYQAKKKALWEEGLATGT